MSKSWINELGSLVDMEATSAHMEFINKWMQDHQERRRLVLENETRFRNTMVKELLPTSTPTLDTSFRCEMLDIINLVDSKLSLFEESRQIEDALLKHRRVKESGLLMEVIQRLLDLEKKIEVVDCKHRW